MRNSHDEFADETFDELIESLRDLDHVEEVTVHDNAVLIDFESAWAAGVGHISSHRFLRHGYAVRMAGDETITFEKLTNEDVQFVTDAEEDDDGTE